MGRKRVAVRSKPVLLDVNKRFVFRTDACDRGLGAALMQVDESILSELRKQAIDRFSDWKRQHSVTERCIYYSRMNNDLVCLSEGGSVYFCFPQGSLLSYWLGHCQYNVSGYPEAKPI